MRKWKRGGGSTTPSAHTPSPSPSPSIQPCADSYGHGLPLASGYNSASEAQPRHGLASESGSSPVDAHNESNRGRLPPPSPSPSTHKNAALHDASASASSHTSAYLPPGGRGRRAGGAWASSSPGAGRGRGMARGVEFGASERADSVASNMTEASDLGRGTPAMSEAGRGAEESKGGKGWEKIPRQSVSPSS